MSMLVPFWVWVILGFVLGWFLRGYLGRKFAFLKKVRDPLGGLRGKKEGQAGTSDGRSGGRPGPFARLGEYLATKPVEILMGGKPGMRKRDPDPDDDKEKK